MGAGQRDNVAIVEPHAVEDRTEVRYRAAERALVRVREPPVGRTGGAVGRVGAARGPRYFRASHVGDGDDAGERVGVRAREAVFFGDLRAIKFQHTIDAS